MGGKRKPFGQGLPHKCSPDRAPTVGKVVPIAMRLHCADTPRMRHMGKLGFSIALLSACATVRAAQPEAEASLFPPLPSESSEETGASLDAEARSPSPMVTTVQSLSTGRQSRSSSPRTLAFGAFGGPAATPTTTTSAKGEMLDIEATLNLVVDQVATSAAELRAIVRQRGGLMIEDVVDESNYSNGRFLIRIAAPGTDELMAAIERLGQLRTRQVNAHDIGKQYNDAELQLENLNVAMARYEQILAKADKVSDLLSIERELTRLRGEIEQVKGNLRWMQDRAARSTIHVNLASTRLAVAQGPIAPQAKLYPGLRATFLEDLRGNNVHQGYVGGGLSFRANREFSLDLDGLRRTSTGAPVKGLDIVLITIGGETFSEFLGNGTRRFLNPYLGWRTGYARFDSRNEFALGGTLGLELVKTRFVSVDLAARAIGLLGHSAHFALEPDLTVGFAF
jgi:hypothetical protein